VFVRKLRQKLEAVSPDWRYVHTHFGVGYRFAAEPVEGTPAAAQAGAPAPAAEASAPERRTAAEGSTPERRTLPV
jgi:two-component system response regulator RegX3